MQKYSIHFILSWTISFWEMDSLGMVCRTNPRFSFLIKFYSTLFLVLGRGVRKGRKWYTGQALHIRLYLSIGKSPDFGDSWLSQANTALWWLCCQAHSAFALKAGRMLPHFNEVTSKRPLKSKQEQVTSWLQKSQWRWGRLRNLCLETCATSLRSNKYI